MNYASHSTWSVRRIGLGAGLWSHSLVAQGQSPTPRKKWKPQGRMDMGTPGESLLRNQRPVPYWNHALYLTASYSELVATLEAFDHNPEDGLYDEDVAALTALADVAEGVLMGTVDAMEVVRALHDYTTSVLCSLENLTAMARLMGEQAIVVEYFGERYEALLVWTVDGRRERIG